ncbi:L,D-transpeptidase [Legionella nagasakiensis]|uniref:L,D-transpeptidase n=1 Tax=Legionella nagasakiensis TaxID=535290 RepID=UPI0013EFA284|nr:L,D-transpeptidase [Legionella nagasakiensis]
MDENRACYRHNLARCFYQCLIIGSVAFLFLLPVISFAAPGPIEDAHQSMTQQMHAVNTFIYNPKTLRWKAVKNDKVIRTGKGSGGSHYCRDIKRSCRTPSGTYRIISKRGASCRSSRYPVGKGGAPMPYCMFFSKYYAIHGSPDVPNHNASHGCIRVKPSDARWLNQNFMNIGSKVIVKPY